MDNPMTPRLVELVRAAMAADYCDFGCNDKCVAFCDKAKAKLFASELSRLMAEGGWVGAGAVTDEMMKRARLAYDRAYGPGGKWRDALRLAVEAALLVQANEVKRLSNPVDDGAVERDKLRAELAAQDNFILTFTNVSRNGDWACAQCKPHSGTIKAGFVCGYHRAEARAALEAAEPHP